MTHRPADTYRGARRNAWRNPKTSNAGSALGSRISHWRLAGHWQRNDYIVMHVSIHMPPGTGRRVKFRYNPRPAPTRKDFKINL